MPIQIKDEKLTVVLHGGLPEESFRTFVRKCVEGFRADTGDDDRCDVKVEAIRDGWKVVHRVSVELGFGPDPIVVHETNRNPFVAIQGAFLVARRWADDRVPHAA